MCQFLKKKEEQSVFVPSKPRVYAVPDFPSRREEIVCDGIRGGIYDYYSSDGYSS